MREELTAIPLAPELHREIGIVALDHEPAPPIVAAIWNLTREIDLRPHFDFLPDTDRQAVAL
jgi:hypothetical protein